MKKIKGFSLFEAMVAIVIIGVVSLAAFEFFRHCNRYAVNSELRLIALNFARETMEKYYFSGTVTQTGGWQAEDLPTGAEFGSEFRDTYGGERYYQIKDGTDTTYTYMVTQVKVTWD